jgi:DNA-binding CsgD family transcriptional regulator
MKASYHVLDLTGQTIYQLNEEEKICEVWQTWDMLGLFKQMKDEKPVELMKQAAALSLRERECLKLLLEGKTAKETAQDMQLSFRTVEYYFENIKNKLHCFSKRELFAYAHRLEKHRIL